MEISIWQFAVDFGLMVLIWMVQLLIYPSFEFLDSATFKQWHARYARNMTFIVAPLMFGQAGFVVKHLFEGMDLYSIIYSALALSTWVTTFLIFVPIHHRLDTTPHDKPLCRKLDRLNWIRVVIWTVIIALDVIAILN
jgi:hypothetical protein